MNPTDWVIYFDKGNDVTSSFKEHVPLITKIKVVARALLFIHWQILYLYLFVLISYLNVMTYHLANL